MTKFKESFKSKKNFKKRNRVCKICGEKRYELLDVHRIIAGGPYCVTNCVCICTSCHRKHHTGLIQIKGWFHSTRGRVLLYIDEEKKEHYI